MKVTKKSCKLSDLKDIADSKSDLLCLGLNELFEYDENGTRTSKVSGIAVSALSEALGNIGIVFPPTVSKNDIGLNFAEKFTLGQIASEVKDVKISIYDSKLTFKFFVEV